MQEGCTILIYSSPCAGGKTVTRKCTWCSGLQSSRTEYCLKLNKPYFGKDTIKPWQSGQIITLRVGGPISLSENGRPSLLFMLKQNVKCLGPEKEIMCPFLCLCLSRGYVCALPLVAPTLHKKGLWMGLGLWVLGVTASGQCEQPSLVCPAKQPS